MLARPAVFSLEPARQASLLEILPTVAAAVRRRRSRLEWRRSSDMGLVGSSRLRGSSGVWCTGMADCIGVRGSRRPVPGAVGCFGRAAPDWVEDTW